jgi:hypothetical protein
MHFLNKKIYQFPIREVNSSTSDMLIELVTKENYIVGFILD